MFSSNIIKIHATRHCPNVLCVSCKTATTGHNFEKYQPKFVNADGILKPGNGFTPVNASLSSQCGVRTNILGE